ncbi:MAG: hypothetical protein QOD93_1837 [Acetobacteraceae bacterium]|nr:hypothetical protein [Acetobacteraceae bacterium]
MFSLRDYPESVGLLDLPGWQKTTQASAIRYSVAPTDDKRTMWTAHLTLELRGSEGPALRRKAHDEATTGALKELQARAASVAETLGLHVEHTQDVRLDGPGYQPRPLYPAMAMAARAIPAPQATASPEDATAEVSADYILRP